MKIVYEKSDCSRCGGTGFFGTYGVCFRCGGAKTFLTRAGRAAAAKFDTYAEQFLTISWESVVGKHVLVPDQFAGILAGGGTVTQRFARTHEVLSATPATQGDGYEVVVRMKLTHPSQWFRYDADAMTLTFTADRLLRRRATAAELQAVYPTLGVGATLLADDGTVLAQNVKTAKQIASAEAAVAKKQAKKDAARTAAIEAAQADKAAVQAALDADPMLWTDAPHPSIARKTYRDYAVWCVANGGPRAWAFLARHLTVAR